MATIAVQNLQQTEAFGRRLGAALFPGAVVALVGQLGAGKTQLVRAIAQGAARVGHAMVLLVVSLQSLQDLVRFLNARFRDLDLLETSCQRPIALEVALVVVVRRRTDTAQLSGSEHRLQDVGRI